MKKVLLPVALAAWTISMHAQLITATGSTAVARMFHSSQMLNNGKVVVFGGYNGNAQSPVFYTSAEIYNNGTWSYTGSMNHQRYKVSSALLSNGNILAIGGTNSNMNETASCEIYNASTGTWSYTDSLNTARSNARIVVLNNGKILAAGGQYTSTCELYDQTTNTWTATGSMNVTRYDGFALSKLPDGRVLATGGNNTNSAEIYDPSTGTWTNVANTMTQARQYHQSILMGNGKVLIAGGDFTLTSEVYNPTTNTFTAAGNLAHYVSNCPMVNLSNGKVLIYGIGDLFNFTDRGALQVFNPGINQWYSAGVVSPAIFTGAVYTVHILQNNKILYVDGNFSTGNGANPYCYLVDQNAIAASVEEQSNIASWETYPNPATNQVTVDMELEQDSNVKLQLYDVLGNTVMEFTDESNGKSYHRQLDMIALPQGVYFLSVQSGKETRTAKIVKR